MQLCTKVKAVMVGVCEYWDEAKKGVDRFHSFQLDSEFGLIPGYLPARRVRNLRPFDSDVITGSSVFASCFRSTSFSHRCMLVFAHTL
jgi:hypothetical protein